MNELFSQGGKGSTGILTNKQAVARYFGVKQSDVVYFSPGTPLTGYKVIYDKESQRAYSLPADIGSGVTAVSLSPAGVLVHSTGSVDLGALAVTREEYVTLPGSFDTGVTVNTKNELVVFTDGKYRWDGTLPKEVSAGSTPKTSGGVGLGAWVSVGDASLRTNLSSNGGFGLIGTPYGGTLSDTIKYGTPEMYLSVSSDVTAAIQNAMDNHDTIDMSGRDWTIERPIGLHDGNSLDLRSANIISNVGAGNHIFVAEDAIQNGINVIAGGGVISGTAKSVFYFQGSTLTPSASADYARNIRISGVYCSSDNIDHFIYMYGAVRQVFLNNCYAYVKGGMYAEGKIVEIYSNNCMWYGSGSATASDARLTVKAINPGYVPEGFHFTENLFDGTGYSWNVTDMYVMTVSGGYIGGDGLFGQPIALNHFINITGSECKGSIIFSPTSANDYRANIQPAIMHSKGVSGSVIIGDNANGINVTTKLIASAHPSNAGVGVVVGNGCTNIQLDLSVDQTYDRAATFNGASGARCSVLVRNYLGSSNAVHSDRPVNIITSPVTNSVSLGLVEKYENIPADTYTVGSAMASISINAARGKRGVIILNMSLSGLAAGTSQVFTITVPSNLIVPSGTGWTSLAIRPQFTTGLVSMEIPFYTNADIVDGSITVNNFAGNSAVVALNAYVGYKLL